jgi:proteasome lid subunit RPN8/RPN11
MPLPMTIWLPQSELEAFENRAKASFPLEREEWVLGKIDKRHFLICHIVPTLPEHVAEASSNSVTLWHSAYERAQSLAEERNLQVIANVHSHPYKKINPWGLMLSESDWKGFDPDMCPILGVVKIVKDKADVSSFKCWWGFWQKDKSLGMRIKYT